MALRTERAFTLIELAIVLSIIGLVLVAVLRGQSLIGGAQAKNVIGIVQDLRIGVTNFRQRYHYLPGDWPYSVGEISGVGAGTSVGTNGNGLLEGAIAVDGRAELGSEVAELPFQLFSAGFIGQINASNPQQRLGTTFGAVHVVSAATANGLVPGFAIQNPSVQNAIVFANLPCDVANEVDTKIDDGSLAKGKAIGSVCAGDQPISWFAVAL